MNDMMKSALQRFYDTPNFLQNPCAEMNKTIEFYR